MTLILMRASIHISMLDQDYLVYFKYRNFDVASMARAETIIFRWELVGGKAWSNSTASIGGLENLERHALPPSIQA